MAKISAHGATEIDRIKTPHGSTYVLTSDGRILFKMFTRDSFSVAARYKDMATAKRTFAALRHTLGE